MDSYERTSPQKKKSRILIKRQASGFGDEQASLFRCTATCPTIGCFYSVQQALTTGRTQPLPSSDPGSLPTGLSHTLFLGLHSGRPSSRPGWSRWHPLRKEHGETWSWSKAGTCKTILRSKPERAGLPPMFLPHRHAFWCLKKRKATDSWTNTLPLPLSYCLPTLSTGR